MNVLLANPPFQRPGWFYVRAGARWPHFEPDGCRYMPFPFFMAYAAAMLEKGGVPVSVIDACAERISEECFLQRIEALNPSLVVLETSNPSFDEERKTARQIKQRFPETRVALVGPWVDPGGGTLLGQAPEIDFRLAGEYEESLLALVQALKDGSSLEAVAALEYRDGSEIRTTPWRVLRDNLDELPFPARHLFKMDLYEDLVGVLPQPSLQIWGSRGCPFGCSFCVWPQVMYRGRRFRPRRPEAIVDEVVAEMARHSYRSFYFDDDTFNIGKERMLRLAEELQKRGPGLPWGMMARADTSDEETLLALRNAGLCVAKFGLESGVQGLVDAARKELDLEIAFSRIRFAKSIGITIHLTLTFGLPGETRRTVRTTVERVLALDPDSVQFSILTPFPGCELFDDLVTAGRLETLDWAKFDGYATAAFDGETLAAAELERARAWAERRWRRHQLKQGMAHPVTMLTRVFSKPRRVLNILGGWLRRS